MRRFSFTFTQTPGRRVYLKGKLDLLTQDDPQLDPLVDIEYIVLRRFNNKSRNWFDADFVDGDKVDNNKQWFEGSFHSQTTVRELFAKKHRATAGK